MQSQYFFDYVSERIEESRPEQITGALADVGMIRILPKVYSAQIDEYSSYSGKDSDEFYLVMNPSDTENNEDSFKKVQFGSK